MKYESKKVVTKEEIAATLSVMIRDDFIGNVACSENKVVLRLSSGETFFITVA